MSESVLDERKAKLAAFLMRLLLLDPVPLDLLSFLQSRERLTAYRFLDKERQSLGSVTGGLSVGGGVNTNDRASWVDINLSGVAADIRGGSGGGGGHMRTTRITSTGSLIDDVTAQDFAILKVLGQVNIIYTCYILFLKNSFLFSSLVLSCSLLHWAPGFFWPRVPCEATRRSTVQSVRDEGLCSVLLTY